MNLSSRHMSAVCSHGGADNFKSQENTTYILILLKPNERGVQLLGGSKANHCNFKVCIFSFLFSSLDNNTMVSITENIDACQWRCKDDKPHVRHVHKNSTNMLTLCLSTRGTITGA